MCIFCVVANAATTYNINKKSVKLEKIGEYIIKGNSKDSKISLEKLYDKLGSLNVSGVYIDVRDESNIRKLWIEKGILKVKNKLKAATLSIGENWMLKTDTIESKDLSMRGTSKVNIKDKLNVETLSMSGGEINVNTINSIEKISLKGLSTIVNAETIFAKDFFLDLAKVVSKKINYIGELYMTKNSELENAEKVSVLGSIYNQNSNINNSYYLLLIPLIVVLLVIAVNKINKRKSTKE